MAQINISIDDKLLSQIDEYVNSNYMNRSQFFTMISNQYLDSFRVGRLADRLVSALMDIRDNGDIDEDIKKDIDKLQHDSEIWLKYLKH